MLRVVLPALLALLASNPALAIIGGAPVPDGNAPWMAAIIDESVTPSASCLSSGGSETFCRQVCGGALVAPSWVLTAAHCLIGRDPATLAVVVGVEDLDSDAVATRTYSLAAAHRHPLAPESSAEIYTDDIALLQLASPVDGETASIASADEVAAVESIALATRDEVEVFGWGRLGPTGGFPPRLQHVGVDLMMAFCEATYSAIPTGTGFNEAMWLCAAEPEADVIEADDAGDGTPTDPGGEDACVLDSGGPLAITGGKGAQVAAIVSWGQTGDCGNPLYPTVYNRVTPYLDWIESVTAAADDGLGDLGIAIDAPASAGATDTPAVVVTLANNSISRAYTAPSFTLDVAGDAALSAPVASNLDCTAITGGWSCAWNGGATMAPGDSATATFTASAASGDQALSLTASVARTPGENDYRASNDGDSQVVAFTAKPDIRLSVAAVTADDTTPGQAWLVVKVSNASAHADATGVRVAVSLPDGTSFVSSDAYACTGTSLLDCDIGNLAAGASAAFTLALSSAGRTNGTAQLAATANEGDYPVTVGDAPDASASASIEFAANTGGGSGSGGGGGTLPAAMLALLALAGLRRRRR